LLLTINLDDTAMNNTIFSAKLNWVLILFLFCFIGGCNKQTVDTNVVANVAANDTGNQITGIVIPGFSASDILINAKTKEITLLIPEKPKSEALQATLSFNCAECSIANLIKSNTLSISLCANFPKEIKLYGSSGINVYKLNIKPTGELKSTGMAGPIYYQLGSTSDRLLFFIDNYYDGSRGKILLHLKGSSRVDTAYIEQCVFQNTPDLGQFIAHFYPKEVGQYSLELIKESGRKLVFPYPLIVSKGVPVLGSINVSIENWPQYSLYGSNLYEEDSVSFLLKQVSGYQAYIKPIRYEEEGRRIYFRLPADIKPGYYYAQPVRQGVVYPFNKFGGIIITQKPRYPFVGGNSVDAFFNPSPLPIKRGIDIGAGIVSLSVSIDDQAQYIFREVNNPKNEVIADVKIPYGYWQGWTEGTGASFQLPLTMKPGIYQLTPQFVSKDKILTEGLPYPIFYSVE
jgi:hypothetical protein